jgi:hypothetical protein
LAKALHPNDEELSQNQTAEWSHLLKEEGGDVLIAVLEEWGWPQYCSARHLRCDWVMCIRSVLSRR